MADAVKRVVMRTADEPVPLPGCVIRNCSACRCSVWYDALQTSPYPDLPEVLICTRCGDEDPDVAPELDHLRRNPDEAFGRFLEALRTRKGMPK